MALQVILHPLPVLNISDHYTRNLLNQPSEPKVYGALLGTQNGRNLEITNTFEIKVSQSEHKVDHDYLSTRREQFKQVFPTFDFLGWYSIGDKPDATDLQIHKQFETINESSLFLQLNAPSSLASLSSESVGSSSDLPLTIYEVIQEIIDNVTKSTFVPIAHTMETGEAERIALDHTAKPSEQGSDSATIAHLKSQRNAINMLYSRVGILKDYLTGVHGGSTKPDYDLLRDISSLLSSIPTSSSEFQLEYLKEYNDVLLTTYLSGLTKNLDKTNQLLDTISFATSATAPSGLLSASFQQPSSSHKLFTASSTSPRQAQTIPSQTASSPPSSPVSSS